jgi:hypothetical protein
VPIVVLVVENWQFVMVRFHTELTTLASIASAAPVESRQESIYLT